MTQALPVPLPGLKEPLCRLIAVVEAETRALRAFEQVEFEELNRKKGHGLLDLMRRSRNHAAIETDSETAGLLRDLRIALNENMSVISMHLDAVKAVSTLIASAIRNQDSDCTYSMKTVHPVRWE